ncbi:retrotransposon protein, putative, ty3-gypsy subclass [Tanacetum coccineum]
MMHGATAVTVAVMIVPLNTIYLLVAGVASLTEAKAPVKPIWVEGKRSDSGLKKITDDKGPVPIRFEWDDKKTLMPLGEHASHWSNYLGELIREMHLYYPSWKKVPAERKAVIVTKIGRWTDINAGIQQHLQKLYNTNKASLKAAHWVINPETGTYDVESIRERRPESITLADWDAHIAFWNYPRNQARAAQNCQNRAKSTVLCQQVSRSLARLRDQMMESSATREYPSLIHTFFVTHTVNGVFTRDEDRVIYEEMLRLQALGSNTETGVPYTEEEIMAIVRKGKQRGHLPGVGRVLPGRATDGCPPPPQSTVDPADVEKLKKSNKSLTKQFGGASGSGGCGDDEPGGDEDGDEDEEDEEDDDNYVAGPNQFARNSRPVKVTLARSGPTKSLGKVARESISGELSPSTYPGRHVARDWYPQRQVAREGVELSLGIVIDCADHVKTSMGLVYLPSVPVNLIIAG